VVGIDLRAENIVKARQLFQHPNLSFLQGDVLQGLPKESFNVIMLSNILEHIEQRVEFLTIVHERLSPQRCLIRVPMFNRDWRVPLREGLANSYFRARPHYTEYQQERLDKQRRAEWPTHTHLQTHWGGHRA